MSFADLFSRIAGAPASKFPALVLHNTLSGTNETFTLPAGVSNVRMYNCGPTVYGRQHIGNLSMFVFTDILRRTLEYNGFTVKQVINFTDFGHLSSDADEGEDKMAIGLKREGLEPTLANMRVLGEKYANLFLEDIRLLNIEVDRVHFPRASDYVPAQIAMIKTLEEKGYTYAAKAGLYFDTSRFSDYGKLGNIDIKGLREGARVKADPDKRHPTDFILWKPSAKTGWDSPWGMGFPGWHIECSAMIRSCLGEKIDIHTGGIEHIAVHHNNEIAQSECATGKRPLSRFWLHREHLQFEGGKLAKSSGNVVYLSDLIDRGFHPLSFRYLLLGSHYRTPSNFTWEALSAAQTALSRLATLRESIRDTAAPPDGSFLRAFRGRINNDLDTAGALGALWEVLRGDVRPGVKLGCILEADRIFGLRMDDIESLRGLITSPLSASEIPDDLSALLHERDSARAEKDFPKADALRERIRDAGYDVEDTPEGARLTRITPQERN